MANVELVKAIKVGNVVTSLGELAAGDTITMKGDGASTAGAIAINNATNANSTTITSGNVSANITFTLPDAVGSVGQVLKVSTVPDANSNVLTWGADTEGIASLSADSNPTLSQQLDVNDNIVTNEVVNGNVTFQPNGTGVVDFKNDNTQASQIRLFCESNNSHWVALKSASHAELSLSNNVTLTLPAETGTVSTQSYATGKAVAFSIVFGG